MEAITAIKIQEWAGILAEGGPEAIDGLFAQVLAGQQAKTGQGLKPAAGNSEDKGLKPGRPGAEDTLPTPSTEGTSSEAPPLLVAAAVLTPGLVPDGDPVPAGIGLNQVWRRCRRRENCPRPCRPPPYPPSGRTGRNPGCCARGGLPADGIGPDGPGPESPGLVGDGAGHDGAFVAAPVRGVTGRPPERSLSSPALRRLSDRFEGVSGTPEVVQKRPGRPASRPYPQRPWSSSLLKFQMK